MQQYSSLDECVLNERKFEMVSVLPDSPYFKVKTEKLTLLLHTVPAYDLILIL